MSMLFMLLWLTKVRSGPFVRSSRYCWAAPKRSCQLGRASAGNHLHRPQGAPLFCSLYSHTEDVLAAAEHQIVTAGTRSKHDSWLRRTINKTPPRTLGDPVYHVPILPPPDEGHFPWWLSRGPVIGANTISICKRACTIIVIGENPFARACVHPFCFRSRLFG